MSGLACSALVVIGKPAIPSLLEIPKDAPQTARINATRALAEIADHSAIPALMAALEDDSVMIQHWAEEGLERLGLDMVYLKPE
jgi:HEAT repeat protein